jgi:hypothetical protein
MAQKSHQSNDPSVTHVLKELAGSISKALDGTADLSTAVPGLALYRNTAPTAPNPCTYEPSLLLIPQGKKRVDLGKQSYVFGESTFLLTSIELPIVSRVSIASVEKPYLAFFLKLDMGIVRDVLHTEEVRISAPPVGTRGMVLGEATVELLTHGSAFRRSAGCPVLWQAAPARNHLPASAGAPGRSSAFGCNDGGSKLSNG